MLAMKNIKKKNKKKNKPHTPLQKQQVTKNGKMRNNQVLKDVKEKYKP